MDIYGQIAGKLRDIAKKGKVSETLILPARVKSVSETTCTVCIDDLEITDVRLRAVINSEAEQLLIKPKVESYVLIADLSGGSFRDFAVISYSEVEEISLKIDSQTLVANKDGFVFNGGKNGGIAMVKELTEKINELVKWCSNHTHSNATFSGTISGNPATGTLTVPQPAQSPTKLEKSQYENISVKH